MQEWLSDLEAKLDAAVSLDEGLDVMLCAFRHFGLESINYDYSPVPLDANAEIVTPKVLMIRNAPDSMIDLWRNHGYYQIDPVMRVANRHHAPFAWSYLDSSSLTFAKRLDDASLPVQRYLHDTNLTVGVTVPIRQVDGALSTFTGIRIDPERTFEKDIGQHLGFIGVAAHLFHNFVALRFPETVRVISHIRLTPRERECLELCALGLSAKQIARKLDRSVGTATLHLQSAIRKLGARNRVHAASIAIAGNLIDKPFMGSQGE